MYSLLITLTVILSVILVIMILLQASKGDGLAGSIGGGQNLGSMFGSHRTADFLSKSTWWLGGAVLALSISINLFFLPGATTQAERESIIQSSQQQQVPSTSTLPVPDAGTPAETDDNSGTEENK